MFNQHDPFLVLPLGSGHGVDAAVARSGLEAKVINCLPHVPPETKPSVMRLLSGQVTFT